MSDDARKRTHEGVTKMATESTPAEVLSKRGDVILHVGKAPRTERKLLVSSVQLSFASPVFAAMFSGRFAEGQPLTPDSPHAVTLPEDDADAMGTVCKIIHIQVTNLGVTTTPANLVSIALVAHKYDCVEAVKAWSMLWTADILRKPGAADFGSTLLATFLLDLAPEFLKVSKSLIRDRSELLSVTAMSNGQEFLSPSILEYIVKAQSSAQTRAWTALGPLGSGSESECKPVKGDNAFFFNELCKNGLWPIRQLSVAQIKASVKEIPNSPVVGKCSSGLCKCRTTGRADIKFVLAEVTGIYNTVKGLCLNCVKKLELGIDRAECRVQCDGKLVKFLST